MPHKGDRPQGFKKGNYNGTSDQRVKNSTLPPKIKCNICGRNKDVNQFSNKQLENARARLAAEAYSQFNLNRKKGGAGLISCRECNPEPVGELCCVDCGQTKDLSQFARNQRKNPDNAKCAECVEVLLKIGEGEERVEFDNPYDDNLSDGEFDDYLDEEDLESTNTGISNPWAQYGDGNYVTTDDVESGRWPSEAGSSYKGGSNYSSRSSNASNSLTKENVHAFNRRSGTQDFDSSYATPTSARTASHASRVTDNNLMDADSRYGEEDEYNFDDASQRRENSDEFANTNAGRAFESWGPQAQSGGHLRGPSTGAASNEGRANRSSDRSFINNRYMGDSRPGNQRGRGQDNRAARNKRFPKVRPDNSLEATGYYEQNGDLGQNGWKKDPSLW